MTTAQPSDSESGSTQSQRASTRKPKKLWKVGELSRHSGLSRQAIHNYVLLGLIREEERTPSGHRLFGSSVFARLGRIEQLKRKGMRLQEIAEVLDRTDRRRRTNDLAGR